MLKNKHLTVALLIAPILAVMAYFATDHVVSEKPELAISGSDYKLSANPNCRYESGKCTLKNYDVELEITLPESHSISIAANIPLQTVEVKVISPNNELKYPTRIELSNTDRQRMTWFSKLPNKAEADQLLQVVIDTGDVRLFHETPMIFINTDSKLSR